jgi:hypothetical protein
MGRLSATDFLAVHGFRRPEFSASSAINYGDMFVQAVRGAEELERMAKP